MPAGTFTNCYKFKKQVLNAAPDDIPPGGAAEWYEWVCPGVGMVKWTDYWTDAPRSLSIGVLESHGRLNVNRFLSTPERVGRAGMCLQA